MPIKGVPLVLENLLESLVVSHLLKSWNIFSENDGNFTFRLRFSLVDSNTCNMESQSIDKSVVTYKRKSHSTVRRDQSRTLKRQNLNNLESSEPLVPAFMERPTCENYSEPETPEKSPEIQESRADNNHAMLNETKVADNNEDFVYQDIGYTSNKPDDLLLEDRSNVFVSSNEAMARSPLCMQAMQFEDRIKDMVDHMEESRRKRSGEFIQKDGPT